MTGRTGSEQSAQTRAADGDVPQAPAPPTAARDDDADPLLDAACRLLPALDPDLVARALELGRYRPEQRARD
ncbi:hypothetical protein SAMN05216251_12711 [Actinacidiphila alni]|uniref:Uncharacterized protein n=1 Tax=Actinacidiphila alni TaxID=380248 RepID=A0A1I2L7Q6_9ACTN|nr:hypothetical protein [Actinacidiphila alni]SFF74588.1 hypothetical protein SAMN05216251_12711 [Actinacidiphila alni]